MEIRPNEFGEEPLSSEDIRFRNVKLTLYPDRRRVKVSMRLTPFISPPNIEIDVRDESDNRVANAVIVGVSGPELDVTLHIRGEVPAGDYRFLLSLGYQEHEDVDQREVILQIPNSAQEG
jgi:hypothetical protein